MAMTIVMINAVMIINTTNAIVIMVMVEDANALLNVRAMIMTNITNEIMAMMEVMINV